MFNKPEASTRCQNAAHKSLYVLKSDGEAAAAWSDSISTKSIFACSMDGPSVSWTINDIFKFDNRIFLLYHCMGSGYDYFTPLGCLIGGLALPRTSKFSHLTALQAAGTGSAVAGGIGLTLGLMSLVGKANSKDPAIPFDSAGIQRRVDGISHNYRIRAMDLGVWIGTLTAGGAMLAAGGPTKLGLSAGSLGRVQGLALGSALGSIVSNIVVETTK